jgi:hypothetical protein
MQPESETMMTYIEMLDVDEEQLEQEQNLIAVQTAQEKQK